MTTAAAVAKALADAGIERVFGLPGGEVLVLIDELRKAGIDFVLMRHEANAGTRRSGLRQARDAARRGDWRRWGRAPPTCCCRSRARTSIRNRCWPSRAQLPDDFPASHTHQLLPLDDIYRPVCRRRSTDHQRRSADDAVERALTACMERPYGASYLTLSAREALKPSAGAGGARVDARRPPDTSAWRRDRRPALRDCARVARRAKRPLVLIGLGIDNANAARIRRWLDEWSLAGRRHAEGQGHRRRNAAELRRRDQRHGRGRLDGRGAQGRPTS